MLYDINSNTTVSLDTVGPKCWLHSFIIEEFLRLNALKCIDYEVHVLNRKYVLSFKLKKQKDN